MNKLPTAEEFLIRNGCQRMDCDGEHCNFFEDVQPKDLIEFAKLHVRAALKAANENAKVTPIDHEEISEGSFRPIWGVDDSSILNSYPLTNIK